MALSTTDKCCCCFTLRLGAIIIGALGLFGSIGGLVREPQEESDIDKAISDYLEEHTAFLYLVKFLYVVGVVISIALLIGAILINRTLVWVYIVGNLCSLVIEVPLTAFLTIVVEEYAGLIALVVYLLPLYFIWVAYSFYKDMEARLP